ncbi:MAG: DUF1499 domain-containing protein, partial [Acidobacteria bacterium]|nr:DUF1499 domain-containing protein [Acidobacteriota bacterium]
TGVSSRDDARARHRVEPFEAAEEPHAAFTRLKELVASAPRTVIVAASDDYLHARCRTRLGFVDDLELLLRPAEGVVHVRIASYISLFTDFGANRRRVEALRRRFSDGRESGRARQV